MNLYNDEEALEKIRPFIAFGFSNEGHELVSDTGYVPLSNDDRAEMLNRAGIEAAISTTKSDSNETNGEGSGAAVVSSSKMFLVLFLALLF